MGLQLSHGPDEVGRDADQELAGRIAIAPQRQLSALEPRRRRVARRADPRPSVAAPLQQPRPEGEVLGRVRYERAELLSRAETPRAPEARHLQPLDKEAHRLRRPSRSVSEQREKRLERVGRRPYTRVVRTPDRCLAKLRRRSTKREDHVVCVAPAAARGVEHQPQRAEDAAHFALVAQPGELAEPTVLQRQLQLCH